jgi:hypothetical protein
MTLRVVAVVLAWSAVVGGLTLATLWFARGGGGAVGPEDETLAKQGGFVESDSRRVTSFSGSHIGVHGFFGLATASLLTYAAVRDTDRQTGYVAVLVVAGVAIALGVPLYLKWKRGQRPKVEDVTGPLGGRVEDRLPRSIIYAHGLAAAATVAAVIALLFFDT